MPRVGVLHFPTPHLPPKQLALGAVSWGSAFEGARILTPASGYH